MWSRYHEFWISCKISELVSLWTSTRVSWPMIHGVHVLKRGEREDEVSFEFKIFKLFKWWGDINELEGSLQPACCSGMKTFEWHVCRYVVAGVDGKTACLFRADNTNGFCAQSFRLQLPTMQGQWWLNLSPRTFHQILQVSQFHQAWFGFFVLTSTVL